MKKEEFVFNGCPESPADLRTAIYTPDDKPVKAVLQFVHGVTEHFSRYEAFADELTKNGIAVCGFDLRGHGHNNSLSKDESACFGENGWEYSVEDVRQFQKMLKNRFPDSRRYLLGFSLGSFLVREYLASYPAEKPDGAIIMGTGYQPPFLLKLIIKSVLKKATVCGLDATSDDIQNIAFGNYNRPFKPNKTDFDWLCSDENELQTYASDPLCRKTISAGLFAQLLTSMKKTGEKESFQNIPHDLPILLISGKNDPVGLQGKGVLTVEKKLKAAGCNNVKTQLFENARHDLLHEKDSGAAEKAIAAINGFIAG